MYWLLVALVGAVWEWPDASVPLIVAALVLLLVLNRRPQRQIACERIVNEGERAELHATYDEWRRNQGSDTDDDEV
jgi:hypothetical protein